MVNIYQEDLDFLEEAKNAFQENSRLETYRDKGDIRIALRYGPDRDCINIFKLDGQVLFAHNIMDKTPQLVLEEIK
jgi:hypothetical protein